MKKKIWLSIALLAIVGLFYFTKGFENDHDTSKIVVTIKPIHSLVCRVLEGIEEPVLMDLANNSPHTSDLRPSDIGLLKKASTVIWVGDAYETSMGSKLRKAVEKDKLLTLMESSKLKVLHLRTGDVWGVGCCHEGHQHDHHHSHADGHVWLDIDNAIQIVSCMGEYFTQKKPKFSKLIQENTKKTVRYLRALDQEIKKNMKPFKDKPYIIYHDALQYFDKRYRTKCLGALVHEPGEPLSPKHLMSIQKLFSKPSGEPLFVLSEVEYQEDAKRALGENKVKIIDFDYLGANIQAGPEAYAQIMSNIVQSFYQK
jgi:zinc transport system substrate-binding protein